MKKIKKKNDKRIFCHYCGAPAILRPASEILEKDFKHNLWVCKNFPECNAYVKADKNNKALGSLANPELRKLRMEAHNLFDRIFKLNIMSRDTAYRMLADTFGLKLEDTHIANFDTYHCKATIKKSRDVLKNNQHKISNERRI